MIDIHSHILHGMDDGPLDQMRSIEMAKAAVRAGITHLFATPHHLNEKYNNPKSNILDRVLEINRYLQQVNIPLIIHPGQELRIHQDLFLSLERDELLTLDDRNQYLLLELPSNRVPSYTQEMVYELILKGITPIIAHPEKNREFIENSNLFFELVQEGALTQLTSGSIIGQFGKKVKSFSEKIIEHHMAHFIATDAHNIGKRGFSLQEAYEIITKKYGIQQTFYFKENAEIFISGGYPHVEQPLPIRKKILGIF